MDVLERPLQQQAHPTERGGETSPAQQQEAQRQQEQAEKLRIPEEIIEDMESGEKGGAENSESESESAKAEDKPSNTESEDAFLTVTKRETQDIKNSAIKEGENAATKGTAQKREQAEAQKPKEQPGPEEQKTPEELAQDESLPAPKMRPTLSMRIPAGPLAKSLYLSTDPFIEGVTGDQAAVSALLQDAGVDGGRMSSELDDDERRRLSSLIAAKLALQGVSVTTLKEVCRDRYMLKDHRTDAESLADILNSCGREGLGGVAVGYFLGDRDCLLQAAEVNDASRRRIAEAVSSLSSVGLTQMKNIQYFDSSLMGSTGIICGIAMQYLGDPMKPTVGLNTQNDGRTNVSTRGMWCQLDRGVDLSVAVRQAAEAAGGSGGGHRIAAGATFPNGRESDFLSELDRIIGSQIAAR